MDLVHCILGNFFVFTTLVARCLYVCKDAREPSGRNWNYLSKVFHVFMQKWQLSRHLCKCLLQQMYDKWQWSYQVGVCFRKKHLRQPVMKEYGSSTLWFRNVDCANWRNSCFDDRTFVYLQKIIENYDFSQLNIICSDCRHEVLWCW